MVARALGLALVAFVASACVADAVPPATSTPTEEPVFRPVTTATATATLPPPLDASEVDEALGDAVCWYSNAALAATCLPPGEETLAALQRIALSGDDHFVLPLTDMLWLDVGWERWVREALERLSGQRFATAAEWYVWAVKQALPLPDDYARWKGRLLSIVDPRFTRLVRPRGEQGIGPEDLVWGLVGVSDVPRLDHPQVAYRVEQLYLNPSDVVFGVLIDGEARAYPERVIAWHGAVQDEVGGREIVVLHCVACGGAGVYDAEASDGETYTLATSGLIDESRRLYFDEETESLWDAVSGRAVMGPLAASGVSLRLRASVKTTWGEWSARYPNTQVLTLDTGFVRDYTEGAALSVDAEAEAPLFPVTSLDDRLEAKRRVLGVQVGGETRAYPLVDVERAGIVHDRVGGREIILISPGVGLGVTVYDESDVEFEQLEGPPNDRELVDSEGVPWFVDDEQLLNSRNSRVRRALPSRTAYWFAWSGAHPGTGLWAP